MAAAKNIDWEAVEREYRAGQLSVAEIARQFLISHTLVLRKAKKKGWSRDLADAVRKEVKERLACDVSGEVSNGNTRETLDKAATRGVEVVRQHRALIRELWEIVREGKNQLKKALSGETAGVHIFQSKGDGFATITQALANSVSRLIPLERQAFNLDDKIKPQAGQVVAVLPQQLHSFRAPPQGTQPTPEPEKAPEG